MNLKYKLERKIKDRYEINKDISHYSFDAKNLPSKGKYSSEFYTGIIFIYWNYVNYGTEILNSPVGIKIKKTP
jgi:hypothetical protein